MPLIAKAKRSGIKTVLRSTLAFALFVMYSLTHAQSFEPRIVSADLGTTQILSALGLADHVIAIDLTSSKEPAFRHLPSIGYHRQLSPEGLLSLNADILIGSSHMGPDLTLDVLRETRVEVIQQETPANLRMLSSNIRYIAKSLKREAQGAKVVHKVEEKGARLSAITLKQTTAVFLLDMGGPNGSMAGVGTSGDSFIKLLGLQNLAQFKAYRETSAETLLAMKPDLIVRASRGVPSNKGQIESVYSIPAISIDAGSLVAGISVAAIDEALRVKTALYPALAEAH